MCSASFMASGLPCARVRCLCVVFLHAGLGRAPLRNRQTALCHSVAEQGMMQVPLMPVLLLVAGACGCCSVLHPAEVWHDRSCSLWRQL